MSAGPPAEPALIHALPTQSGFCPAKTDPRAMLGQQFRATYRPPAAHRSRRRTVPEASTSNLPLSVWEPPCTISGNAQYQRTHRQTATTRHSQAGVSASRLLPAELGCVTLWRVNAALVPCLGFRPPNWAVSPEPHSWFGAGVHGSVSAFARRAGLRTRGSTSSGASGVSRSRPLPAELGVATSPQATQGTAPVELGYCGCVGQLGRTAHVSTFTR